MLDTTLLILLGLAALGFISHNTTVAISILVLIIVRVTPLNAFFPWIEKQGLTIGIIILTIGVMGSQPQLVAGLLVGTVLGVALFRGVPVGPLIAAGIISLFIGKS